MTVYNADPEIAHIVEIYFHGFIAMVAFDQWRKDAKTFPKLQSQTEELVKEMYVQQLENLLQNREEKLKKLTREKNENRNKKQNETKTVRKIFSKALSN